MALLRGVVGFFTFFAAFVLKRNHEPAWMFGAGARVRARSGQFVGTLLAPFVRKKVREEWMLAAALLVPGGAVGVSRARSYGRVSLIVAAAAVAISDRVRTASRSTASCNATAPRRRTGAPSPGSRRGSRSCGCAVRCSPSSSGRRPRGHLLRLDRAAVRRPVVRGTGPPLECRTRKMPRRRSPSRSRTFGVPLEIRPVGPDEVGALLLADQRGFGGAPASPEHSRSWTEAELDRTRVAFEGDEIVGVSRNYTFELTRAGWRVRSGGCGVVGCGDADPPAARRFDSDDQRVARRCT